MVMRENIKEQIEDAKERLADLYQEKIKIEKRLSKIKSEISKYQRMLEEDDIVKVASEVIIDDKEFVDWFIKRYEKIEKRKIRDEIKEKVSQQNFDFNDKNSSTYLYSLYHKDELVYIGITKDIKKRINQHKRTNKVFDRYEIVSIFNDRFYALREENILIKKHNPKYNKQLF